MKKLLLAMMIGLGSVLPATAASLTELTPYLSSQYFTWTEQNPVKRVKERGSLFSGGVLLGLTTSSSLTLRLREELFGGQVGYDGATQAPDNSPVQTDVNYFGTRQDLDLGVRIPVRRLLVEPFAGIGYRWWLRDLQDAVAANGKLASGYTESWQALYGRVGSRANFLNP